MRTKTGSVRAGFSLVELLVVIAIIAVLAALTVVVIRSVVDSRQRGNTEATMRTIHKALQQHWTHVIGEARKDAYPPQVMALAGADQRRAQVIWAKLRLIDAFPESYSEVLTSPTMPAWHAYVPQGNRKYWKGYQKMLGAVTAGSPTPAQSSACLLMALSVRRGGAGLKVEDLGPAVRDTDGDGLMEIVDGWGRPIQFVRFPTKARNSQLGDDLQKTNPAPPGSKGSKLADPLDPDGLLLNQNWYGATYTSLVNTVPPPPMTTTCGAEFELVCHPVYYQSPPNAVANYIVPVLASDGSTTGTGDNIYSFSMPRD